MENQVKCTACSIKQRKIRFKRKFRSCEWTYFATILYDEEKHTEESFRKQLCRCLSNLHTRRGWLYIGVFERSPITNRLHFHALVYVPNGKMIGVINELCLNDFFIQRFGRNEFRGIDETNFQKDILLSYFMQCLSKTNERIIYSRGILQNGQTSENNNEKTYKVTATKRTERK